MASARHRDTCMVLEGSAVVALAASRPGTFRCSGNAYHVDGFALEIAHFAAPSVPDFEIVELDSLHWFFDQTEERLFQACADVSGQHAGRRASGGPTVVVCEGNNLRATQRARCTGAITTTAERTTSVNIAVTGAGTAGPYQSSNWLALETCRDTAASAEEIQQPVTRAH